MSRLLRETPICIQANLFLCEILRLSLIANKVLLIFLISFNPFKVIHQTQFSNFLGNLEN